ncbi:MAG: ABC transporter ATP-binding protein [Okeania sp. SIO3B3]|nr:ABC transporter ATP-binding protein [Okeania sp. SIO3B3]
MNAPLLSINDLSVEFTTQQGTAKVLQNINLSISKGEILGLVGETGCGKSVTARCILRLIPTPPGRITSGSILFEGQDLLKCSAKHLRSIRGNRISMIFQEPMSSLNPVFTVGNQMSEVLRLHHGVSKKIAKERCIAALDQVKLPDPDQVFRKYPHELSGGMRQRVMIAMELACNPALLLADEPTTALDVTVQGQVLQIIKEQARERNMAVILITHDMGVVAQVCSKVAVMYAGQVVELAPVKKLFADPQHPYTQGLIAAIPGADAHQQERLSAIPGTVPQLVSPPQGCRFHTRCKHRFALCDQDIPSMRSTGDGVFAACHLLPEGVAS